MGRQVVGGAGGAVAAEDEGIVGLQRDEYGAAAALLDEVEAVVEELSEEHEPQIEGRGEAFVGSDVVEGELGDVVLGAEETVEALVCGDDGDAVVEEVVVGSPDEVCACAACDGDGCGVPAGLVDDQVGDDARVGIDDVAAAGVVGVGDDGRGRWPEREAVAVLIVPEKRIRQPRERSVGGAKPILPQHQVVEGPVNRP